MFCNYLSHNFPAVLSVEDISYVVGILCDVDPSIGGQGLAVTTLSLDSFIGDGKGRCLSFSYARYAFCGRGRLLISPQFSSRCDITFSQKDTSASANSAISTILRTMAGSNKSPHQISLTSFSYIKLVCENTALLLLSYTLGERILCRVLPWNDSLNDR